MQVYAITVCLSESCLSHDVTRALRYLCNFIYKVQGSNK